MLEICACPYQLRFIARSDDEHLKYFQQFI